MSVCKTCGVDLMDAAFSSRSDGSLRLSCKSCEKAKYYNYQKKTPEYWQGKKEQRKYSTEVIKYFRCVVKVLAYYADEEDRLDRKRLAKQKERKAYRKRHQLEKIVRRHNWKANKSGIQGKLSVLGLRRVFESQKGACAYCGCELDQGDNLDLDHIMPKSKGGTNSDDNIQFLCAPCNRSKGAALPDLFVTLLG